MSKISVGTEDDEKFFWNDPKQWKKVLEIWIVLNVFVFKKTNTTANKL